MRVPQNNYYSCRTKLEELRYEAQLLNTLKFAPGHRFKETI